MLQIIDKQKGNFDNTYIIMTSINSYNNQEFMGIDIGFIIDNHCVLTNYYYQK